MHPDRWLSLTVNVLSSSAPGASRASGSLSPPDPEVESIPQILLELGGQGVLETDGSFTTYLSPPEDAIEFVQGVHRRLEELIPGRAEVRWSWLPQEDWDALWRRGLGPRRVTDRILVSPSWDLPEPTSDELLIVMDPGMAFGTAEHGTTRGCIRLLDGRVHKGDRIADVGAGSGILSIVAARLGAGSIQAFEVDPVACLVAEENLVRNGVEDRVTLSNQEIRGPGAVPGGPFHGIVANIQSSVLLPLLPSFGASLSAGGWVILSGILTEERDRVQHEASEKRFRLEEEDQDGEWWSGAFSLL